MHLLKHLLRWSGAASIGLALGGYAAAGMPQLYHVNNVATIARCNLLLLSGTISLIVAYGLERRPALVAWWLGCLCYLACMGYFFWRTITRLELSSYFVLVALIAEMPFAALWWRWARLYSIGRKG